MQKIEREDIQIISRNSSWSEEGVSKALKDHIYNGLPAFKRFLRLLLLGVGTSFTLAGVIFFFAYNWADLHKFIKLGLVEGLIVIITLSALFVKTKALFKNLLLTAAAVLVGVLFAVFGQVYQTGANAYDFFLGWTIFIALWAIIANFAPLWVLFIGLVNITLVLYAEQIAHGWSEMFVFALLFGINLLFLVLFLWLPKTISKIDFPVWFTNLLALATVLCGTIGLINGIFENFQVSSIILFLMALVAYAFGIWYGLKIKKVYYPAIIAFSAIIIVSAFLMNISEDAAMLFAIGLFIIVSVTLLIVFLIKLQKKWAN